MSDGRCPLCRKSWVAGKYVQRTPQHTPGCPLALADALTAAVEANVHTQHSDSMGTFAECVAEECTAARAYRAARTP
jgi:hypothetical protein